MNVFIVEDDTVLLLMLEKMIDRMGLPIIGKAQTGTDAISQILEHTPDLILMDILLKDNIDGISVAKTVSEVYKPAIIYITGNSDRMNQLRAQKIGFHDYLVKPTSYEELRSSIRRIGNGL